MLMFHRSNKIRAAFCFQTFMLMLVMYSPVSFSSNSNTSSDNIQKLYTGSMKLKKSATTSWSSGQVSSSVKQTGAEQNTSTSEATERGLIGWNFSDISDPVSFTSVRPTTDGDLIVLKNDPLFVNFTTARSGLIWSWGFGNFFEDLDTLSAKFPRGRRGRGTATILVPMDHVLMISVKSHYLWNDPDYSRYCRTPYLQLTIAQNGSNVFGLKDCSDRYLDTHVYNQSLTVDFHWVNIDVSFQMRFSFHPVMESPYKLQSGKWDCSRHNYESFKSHVHCNLEPECHLNEDEGSHCPFSSAGCKGGIEVNDKCYQPYNDHVLVDWFSARSKCIAKGGDLPTMRTEEEWRAFWDVFHFGKSIGDLWVGLFFRENNYRLYLYENKRSWVDDSFPFYVTLSNILKDRQRFECMRFSRRNYPFSSVDPKYEVSRTGCSDLRFWKYACEFKLPQKQPRNKRTINFPKVNSENSVGHESNALLVFCPGGQRTYDFLKCGLHNVCGFDELAYECRLNLVTDRRHRSKTVHTFRGAGNVAMFLCDNARQSVPYTLVCDFNIDCADKSDESFCDHKHTPCLGSFQCKSRQCVSPSSLCDFNSDCVDTTDELYFMCEVRDRQKRIPQSKPSPAPAIVHVEKGKEWLIQTMNATDPCPVTHFRCPLPHDYCLPIFMRCNTMKDCPLGEDEEGCNSFQCPGYYRCRASSVCLRLEHLCDGLPHCPLRDDELYCDIPPCPEGCRCQGLTIVCDRPFSGKVFRKQVRYLDASYSNISSDQLIGHVYLIYLKLSWCGWKKVESMDLPNLRHLDMSHNEIQHVNFLTFFSLKNLQMVRLSRNPLVKISAELTNIKHQKLLSVDMSSAKLSILDTSVFANFPQISYLNVSFNKVSTISDFRFSYIPLLIALDLRSNPITIIPDEVYRGLTQLERVYADNYKLCCRTTLPVYFNQHNCYAPQDELSSCEDLLRSSLYRIFLWSIATMSVLGNGVTFLYRGVVLKRNSNSGFNIFVSSLCMADFLMGVYLTIVGVADMLFKGKYILFEDTWKSSIPCKVAGFLSLLSSEVSAFMVCVITLDRFIVVRFPFTSVRFERLSALVASGMVWVVGLILSAVPLLPSTVHWDFYRQSGICIPLPVTRKSFPGRDYAFAVMIVLNFSLFVLIAAGQAAIFRSVKVNTLASDTDRKSKDVTVARRLISVAVSDFLCWFPIGLLGLLSSADVVVSGEVNVIMAIFVLPVNSALNPFLYTLNLIMEKRRIKNERKLYSLIESRLASQREMLKS